MQVYEKKICALNFIGCRKLRLPFRQLLPDLKDRLKTIFTKKPEFSCQNDYEMADSSP